MFKVQEVSPKDCGLAVDMAGQPSGAQEEWSPDIGLCLFEILGRPREDFFVSHVTSSGDQCGTG